MPNTVIVLVSIMIISEWFQRKKEHALEFSPGKVPTLVRWGIYHVIVLFIIWFGGKPQEFFYFQF